MAARAGIAPEELASLAAELSARPGHEKVRSLLHRLLTDGLGVESREIDFEKPAPEVNGRIDALLGRTVFELKSDLRRERAAAESALARYMADRERDSGAAYVGVATDGAEWIAYFLEGEAVVAAQAHRADPEEPRELLVWLQGAVATGDALAPDPHTTRREFGRGSLAAQRALKELAGLWARLRETPEAGLKRALWSRLLRLAYGAEAGDDAPFARHADDALFLQHTYVVVVAKAMAWAAVNRAPPTDPAALLRGMALSAAEAADGGEPDFFDWMLAAEGGPELVMRIAREASRFRLDDIRVDILKALYESLIDPETRHDLGEYYTPDWLAARMVRATVDRPLEQRVMDPACGSGTFLFHAVRAVLAAAAEAGLSPAEGARRAMDNVAGIDVHPVAVIFARVTYLLALLPALRAGRPGARALPVYLGDALQWNLARTGEKGRQPDMLAGAEALEIFVPGQTLADPEPRRLDPATLRFPAAVAGDARLFDRLLTTLIQYGAQGVSSADFVAWLRRQSLDSAEDICVLRDTYEAMRRLQSEGRNHIWGHVARNLARPVWLSSEGQKADVVIGNPPWVSFRYMGAAYQRRFREECVAARLWAGGKVATHQDLSAYFYMRAALLYMRRDGRIALVMPYAAMSRRAYAPFRKGEAARNGEVAFRLRFAEAWSFGPEVGPLFPVPSCVLFARRHDGVTAAPLPEEVRDFYGTLPRRDADEPEADGNLTEAAMSWPEPAVASNGSPYRRVFRQGAILVPRRLVLVEPMPATGLVGPDLENPAVRGRKGNLDKAPWNTVEPPSGAVDAEFLKPVLLGESIAQFRVLRPFTAVIPWDREKRDLMDATTALRRGFQHLWSWLGRTEALWDRHKRSRLTLLEQCDYYGKLSAQFPIAPIRVVYTASGTIPAACVVRDGNAIIDSKLYWAAFEKLDEARYISAVLNSEVLRAGVERYQSRGQWGARDFHKYVFNLPIPRFDGDFALHRALAGAAAEAEEAAAEVALREGEHFSRARKRVRAALAETPAAARVETLAAELLAGE